MKKIAAICLTLLLLLCMAACRNNTDDPGNQPGDNTGDKPQVTTYYEGTINFCAPVGDQKQAYDRVIAAYQELQPGVTVKFTNESTETYPNIIKNDILTEYSENSYNIFAGNYVNDLIQDAAVDMYTYILKPNQYTGKRWRDCLDTAAYVSSGTANTTKMIATNIISVAWYYNKDVIEEVGIDVDSFENWQDLIAACATLKEHGYTAPFGVSVADQSYRGSQLSWLLRVYGDQYYRELYPLIQAQPEDYCYDESLPEFVYEESDPQPEEDAGWNMNVLRMQQLMLDKSNPNYAGPTSARFRELMDNILAISPYLTEDVITTSDQLTGKFVAGGKDAPVFYIDVLGFGSRFSNLIKESEHPFELGIMDFLPMEGEEMNTGILRSLGGNSAWLSVRESKNKQINDMCVDFIQFFMSPYGHSIFVQALIDTGSSLAGPCTVKGVDYPEEWKQVYDNPNIKKNGLCDRNEYLTYLVNPFEVFTTAWLDIYNGLIDAVKAGGVTTDEFYESYYNTVLTEIERINKSKGYTRNEAWKTPTVSPF